MIMIVLIGLIGVTICSLLGIITIIISIYGDKIIFCNKRYYPLKYLVCGTVFFAILYVIGIIL